jgi:hypothetical protein
MGIPLNLLTSIHFDHNFIFSSRKSDVSVESIDFWQLSYTEQVENASYVYLLNFYLFFMF